MATKPDSVTIHDVAFVTRNGERQLEISTADHYHATGGIGGRAIYVPVKPGLPAADFIRALENTITELQGPAY